MVERPERLSLKVLMALLDILDATMDELIEPVAAEPAKQTRQPAVRRSAWRSGTCGPGVRESPGPTRDGPPPAPPVAAPAALVDPMAPSWRW